MGISNNGKASSAGISFKKPLVIRFFTRESLWLNGQAIL
jgi:hypothetical protein